MAGARQQRPTPPLQVTTPRRPLHSLCPLPGPVPAGAESPASVQWAGRSSDSADRQTSSFHCRHRLSDWRQMTYLCVCLGFAICKMGVTTAPVPETRKRVHVHPRLGAPSGCELAPGCFCVHWVFTPFSPPWAMLWLELWPLRRYVQF